MSFGAAGGPLSLMTKNACISPPSLWDEQQSASGGAPESDRRASTQTDYTPQYIMAPAEQLKLAEKLEDEDAGGAGQEASRPADPEADPEAIEEARKKRRYDEEIRKGVDEYTVGLHRFG